MSTHFRVFRRGLAALAMAFTVGGAASVSAQTVTPEETVRAAQEFAEQG